jgi:ppGpp synthetase/RelA/SpoT-type nucleotidyltranferase
VDAEPEDGTVVAPEFDFADHRAKAVNAYRVVRGSYEDLAATVRNLLMSALEADGIKPLSIEFRAKSEESFSAKAARPSDSNSGSPRYSQPLAEITDLAGCRVITFFLKDVQSVRKAIDREFNVIETANRSSYLRASSRPGYESYHFVAELSEARLALPEYSRFRGLRVEIQVRTILQHAWAEIEHDIQYKSVEALPVDIGQRFMALAGMIEIGDREFQAIADAHEQVRNDAAISFAQGRLDEVELTPDTLKAYLDKDYGPDGRMRDWSYEWTTRLLKRFGFVNLQQLDECVGAYDDDAVSRAVWGARQGQLTRLELVVLAAIGPERFKTLHPWAGSDITWFEPGVDKDIDRLRAAGITIGNYVPAAAQPLPLT